MLSLWANIENDLSSLVHHYSRWKVRSETPSAHNAERRPSCSVAGLLTARVLKDHLETGIVMEPDTLLDGQCGRVAQWNHIHSKANNPPRDLYAETSWYSLPASSAGHPAYAVLIDIFLRSALIPCSSITVVTSSDVITH
jgi:hypothetical protein